MKYEVWGVLTYEMAVARAFLGALGHGRPMRWGAIEVQLHALRRLRVRAGLVP